MTGALLFVALQVFFVASWDRLFSPADLDRPWFLGSRRALVVTQTVLSAVAFGVGLRPIPGRRRVIDAGALAAGLVAAMIAVFFFLGPEALLLGPVRLWPVALLSGGLLLLAPVLLGTVLAAGLRALLPGH